jgi:hypothetical protein
MKTLEILTSTTLFHTLDEIDKFIHVMEKKGQTKATDAKVAELNEALHNVPDSDLSFFTPELLSAIDDFTATTFGPCALVLGLADDDYVNRLPTYVRGVCKLFDEYQKGNPHLHYIKGRLRWIYYGSEYRGFIPFPIMTGSAVEMLVDACKPLACALHNVSKSILFF